MALRCRYDTRVATTLTIRKLPQDTVGRIAAGEVIERPAAAVKELLENAIDAGATRIDIVVTEGGTVALEVRDNGGGIALGDLPLAVERHATSKISSLADLDALSTLGFRGEALASLAAVSDLRLRSRWRDDAVGGELVVRFGAVGQVREVAWSQGTSVLARDLFANLPARRKFLRQPATESGYISRVVGAYALAYPGIAFSLEVDGKPVLATDGRGDPIAAATGVWGLAVAEHMVTLDYAEAEHPGYRVHGIISLPTLDRATRQQQHVFAQGRLVSSRQISTAFEQSYHTLTMVGRHPLGCIQIVVPPDRIDVNVHPTKTEVRFADERLVFALVQRAVRTALGAHTPSQPIPTIFSTPLGDQQVQRRLSLSHPEDWPVRPQPAAVAPTQASPDTFGVAGVATVGGRILPALRVLGQVAGCFIVAEGPDGMYLIDQHAAHERIMFERIYSARSADAAETPARQVLLSPVTVELHPAAWGVFLDCKDELASLGFDAEEFGSGSVVIRAVPADLRVRDPAKTLQVMLDEILAGGRGDSRAESLAISAACHSSIRAGQLLSLLEMRELVTQLERCSSPQACGHGRPTMLRMTVEDLERQFSRR